MPDNKIITDREEMLETLKYHPSQLQYASDTLKDDREVVLEAMKSTKDLDQVSNILNFASEELKNDPELKKLA